MSAAGAAAQYGYDFNNRRVKKVVGSSISHFVWQDNRVLAEHDGASGANVADYILRGASAIAKVAGGTTVYLANDRVSQRLALDASGNILGVMGTLPFGEDFAESGSQEKHHFTSYERDAETGTDYAVNRQYLPATGRFIRVDPLGSSADPSSPQSWNRYGYSAGDPVNQVDPLGLMRSTYVEQPEIPALQIVNGCFDGAWFWGACGNSPAGGGTGDPGGGVPGNGRAKGTKLTKKQIADISKFLKSDVNSKCAAKLNSAAAGTMDQIQSALSSVTFFDVNTISGEPAGFYIPTSVEEWGLTNENITMGAVFQPGFRPGVQILAVTQSQGNFGVPGIYALGGIDAAPFQGANADANIEHELAHYVTGLDDAGLFNALNLDPGTDLGQWFQDGCPDPN
ncbi:MAG TPA: RHS repeat-associated core domain-containing protein [Blastocatellia bacterium]|nr:RHS repeat-associated core domain-containing protein [Blastocatellia bacterium]